MRRGVIPPHAYHTAHFEAVSDAELPRICSCLDTAEETFYEICARHWWLTGFRMGVYTKPSRLRLATTLIFPEQEMALAFWEGLHKTGKPRSLFRICGREVSISRMIRRLSAFLRMKAT